jgi:hypothetical protein
MYNLNSVLVEGTLESLTQDEDTVFLTLTTLSWVGKGRCLVDVPITSQGLVRRISSLVAGQQVRVVGWLRFDEDGESGRVVAENFESRPMPRVVELPSG